MKKLDFFFFRLKRRILTNNISNIIVKNNYQQNLTLNYIEKKYKKIIDNSNYKLKKSEDNKVIWFCWFQGIENAPLIVKKCYDSIKKTFKGYKIIVLTFDNFAEYVDIPKYIIDKCNNKIMTYTHFSDILRAELLSKHGGIWIDSTVLSTTEKIPDYIESNYMFCFKEINLNRGDLPLVVSSSWFIKTRANNPIILLTRDLLREYWKNNNFLLDYYLFHLFFSLSCKKYKKIFDDIPVFNNINPHIMQFELKNIYNQNRFDYYKKISDFHKLTFKIDEKSTDKNSNLNYILGDKYEKD